MYKNPFGFIRQVFFKGIIAPLKYGKQGDYVAFRDDAILIIKKLE
jgi:hypothetical protein